LTNQISRKNSRNLFAKNKMADVLNNNNNTFLDEGERNESNIEYDSDVEHNFLIESANILRALQAQQQSSTSINETTDVLQLLVSHVQSYPCLWDRSLSEYKQAHKKKVAWMNISRSLGFVVQPN